MQKVDWNHMICFAMTSTAWLQNQGFPVDLINICIGWFVCSSVSCFWLPDDWNQCATGLHALDSLLDSIDLPLTSKSCSSALEMARMMLQKTGNNHLGVYGSTWPDVLVPALVGGLKIQISCTECCNDFQGACAPVMGCCLWYVGVCTLVFAADCLSCVYTRHPGSVQDLKGNWIRWSSLLSQDKGLEKSSNQYLNERMHLQLLGSTTSHSHSACIRRCAERHG